MALDPTTLAERLDPLIRTSPAASSSAVALARVTPLS